MLLTDKLPITMLYSAYTVFQERDPDIAICQNNSRSTSVIAGTLLGGIVVITLAALLLTGIVCGVCKLRRHPQQPPPADSTPKNK